MKRLLSVVLIIISVMMVFVSLSYGAWTSLVTSGDFTGMQTDVQTVGTGIISVCVIILGVFLIMKAMMH